MKQKSINEQSFAQGAAILLISTVLVKIIGALFKIPLSSDYCLGNLGFGSFSFTYDLYTPISMVMTTGFPVAIAKIMSDYMATNQEEKANSAFKLFFKIMFSIGLFGFVVVLLSATYFFTDKGNMSNNAKIMFAMAPAVVFCSLSSVYRGAFEGYKNMTPPAISNLIDALSKVLFGFLAAFITMKITGNYVYGAVAAMAGITLGTSISFLYLKVAYSNKIKSSVSDNASVEKGIFKSLIIISLPIVFSSLAGNIISLIDALTVNWRLSALMNENFAEIATSYKSYAEITPDTLPTFLYGVRSKAYTLFNIVPTFISALVISALPTLTSHFSAKRKDSLSENATILLKFSSVITFPLAFGMLFVGPSVMTLLYGDNSPFSGGVMLSIYGIAAAGAGITMTLTAILQSCNKQNVAFINFAVGILIKVILNFLLLSVVKLNIYGAVIGTAACYLYVLIADFISLRKCRLKLKFKNSIIKPLTASFLCGVSAYLISLIFNSKLGTVLAIFVAALVYLSFLLILKTFDKKDFDGLSYGSKIIKILKLS